MLFPSQRQIQISEPATNLLTLVMQILNFFHYRTINDMSSINTNKKAYINLNVIKLKKLTKDLGT